jgi:steroid 5-alpha reductase family enzyme
MTLRILIVNAVVLLVFMTVVFLVAKAKDRLDTVDSAWGVAFMVASWSAFLQARSVRSLLVAILVSVWGVRLTNHLYKRSAKRGKDDPRYQEMRDKWKGNVWLKAYQMVFLLQGLLVWIISLPVVMATGHILPHAFWFSEVGAIIWVIGFNIEAAADSQLAAFVAAKKDKNAVLDTGLWRYSRHPNYFGELLEWWAIGIIASQTAFGWIGLLGPLTLTILIVFVSGIPPIERRRKTNPKYREYMRHTSPLFLLPCRKVR